MSYVTTNIRLSEDDYLRLKSEAAKKRKSLSAIIREKLGAEENRQQPQTSKSLLSLVNKAEKESWTGPSDLATNHDQYFTK